MSRRKFAVINNPCAKISASSCLLLRSWPCLLQLFAEECKRKKKKPLIWRITKNPLTYIPHQNNTWHNGWKLSRGKFPNDQILVCKMFAVKKALTMDTDNKKNITDLNFPIRDCTRVVHLPEYLIQRVANCQEVTKERGLSDKWLSEFVPRLAGRHERPRGKKKKSFGNINNHSKILINKLCLQVKPWCDNLSAFEPTQKKKTPKKQRLPNGVGVVSD